MDCFDHVIGQQLGESNARRYQLLVAMETSRVIFLPPGCSDCDASRQMLIGNDEVTAESEVGLTAD